MEWISNSRVMIVGLGLMGGSYARALKRLGYPVSAIDTKEESIHYALEHAIIDAGFTRVEESDIGSADAVIFALYPTAFKEWIRQYQSYLKPGAILTDVTGVKSCIVYDIQAMLREDVEFIAAHPMAGREVYGVENSSDKMFRDANYLVVPTEKNTPAAIDWCRGLGQILGFEHIALLSPEEHDAAIGFVSQLTHCIAVALMTCSDNTHLAEYTGDSFRDLTRIARINEVMWSELFLLNKEQLLEQIERFAREIDTIKTMIRAEDRAGLCEKMRLSTERRARFDKLV